MRDYVHRSGEWTTKTSLILNRSLSLVWCLCLSSRPPFFQFIFQFAPRSSQVCARRKFAEAAGAPLEATWRRDRRVTIRPSPPLLYLPLVSSLSVSSVTSLPGYTGPQGDLLLARVPQHRPLSSSFTHHFASPQLLLLFFSPTPPFPLLLPSPAISPGGRR